MNVSTSGDLLPRSARAMGPRWAAALAMSLCISGCTHVHLPSPQLSPDLKRAESTFSFEGRLVNIDFLNAP
jgi:hypothetical protein